MVSNAAPESARCPRWIRCQSVMQPSSAEYWHIGAITIRLGSLIDPRSNGSNSLLIGLTRFGPIRNAGLDTSFLNDLARKADGQSEDSDCAPPGPPVLRQNRNGHCILELGIAGSSPVQQRG